jgi:hypothetical protein
MYHASWRAYDYYACERGIYPNVYYTLYNREIIFQVKIIETADNLAADRGHSSWRLSDQIQNRGALTLSHTHHTITFSHLATLSHNHHTS